MALKKVDKLITFVDKLIALQLPYRYIYIYIYLLFALSFFLIHCQCNLTLPAPPQVHCQEARHRQKKIANKKCRMSRRKRGTKKWRRNKTSLREQHQIPWMQKLPAYSGAFLLTVDNFSFFTYSWSLFTYSFSFLTYSWSFSSHSGKVRLIRALRDCNKEA